jgi:hypothetical protein
MKVQYQVNKSWPGNYYNKYVNPNIILSMFHTVKLIHNIYFNNSINKKHSTIICEYDTPPTCSSLQRPTSWRWLKNKE